MKLDTAVSVIAPCSPMPQVEFALGLERLKEAGFHLHQHIQCTKRHLFFAGTDEERAKAFFDEASNPSTSVLWCARGGYGAHRLLPLLDQLTAERGAPTRRKLLVGFSDVTALHEYVRERWGWATLHAPMPGSRQMALMDASDFRILTRWVEGKVARPPWERKRLRFLNEPPAGSIEASMVGGNLAVWSALLGTRYAARSEGKFLFLEDIGETLARIDRMVQHLYLAGGFEGVRAIVLGEFTGCEDSVPQGLATVPTERTLQRALTEPSSKQLAPIRKKVSQKHALQVIFGELGERLGIPVAYQLPVGHGLRNSPLPLGATYRLGSQGEFELVIWDWVS